MPTSLLEDHAAAAARSRRTIPAGGSLIVTFFWCLAAVGPVFGVLYGYAMMTATDSVFQRVATALIALMIAVIPFVFARTLAESVYRPGPRRRASAGARQTAGARR